MQYEEDIKIVGKENDINSEENVTEMKNELDFQKINGNLRKAKEIGQRFAFDVCNFNKYKNETEPLICDQLRMLYAFTVDYCLNQFITSEIVASTASISYLTSLKDIDEWFYDHLQISGAFSLYLLQVRSNDNNLSKRIGEAFAKNCLREGEVHWEEHGEKSFNEWCKECESRIKLYELF